MQLQHQPWCCICQLFRQPWPETLSKALVAVKGPKFCQLAAEMVRLGLGVVLQSPVQQGQQIAESSRIATHQQLPFCLGPIKGQRDLKPGRDHQEQGVISVVRLKRQALEMRKRLLSFQACAIGQGRVGYRELTQLLRCPNPSFEMAEKLRFIERGQWCRHPDALIHLGFDHFLLKGLEGGPPETTHPDFSASSRWTPLRQTFAQVRKGWPAHLREIRDRLLWRTTERQRPSAMKFTTIAERP